MRCGRDSTPTDATRLLEVLEQGLVGGREEEGGVPRLAQPPVDPGVRGGEDVDVGRPAAHFLLDEGQHGRGQLDPLGCLGPQVRVVDARRLRLFVCLFNGIETCAGYDTKAGWVQCVLLRKKGVPVSRGRARRRPPAQRPLHAHVCMEASWERFARMDLSTCVRGYAPTSSQKRRRWDCSCRLRKSRK